MLKLSRCVFENIVFKRLLMTAKIVDGESLALQIKNEVKHEIENWVKSGGKKQPYLVTIMVGNNSASRVYVSKKHKAAEYVGIKCELVLLSENVTEQHLIETINDFNENCQVDGILIQLPLPKHLPQKEICKRITPCKDVDGFHVENMGKLVLNIDSLIPCTALAVYEILNRMEIDTFGKHVVLCGRSKHVGLPIALLLHSDRFPNEENTVSGLEATTTICHRNTPKEQLKRLTLMADIVITSAGVPNLIRGDMIKKGACVIDVGFTRLPTSKGTFQLFGDVNFEEVSKVAGVLTPVPGGVGPVTVAMLMKNTLKAAKLNEVTQSRQKNLVSC